MEFFTISGTFTARYRESIEITIPAINRYRYL
jgi:hypothetical protein